MKQATTHYSVAGLVSNANAQMYFLFLFPELYRGPGSVHLLVDGGGHSKLLFMFGPIPWTKIYISSRNSSELLFSFQLKDYNEAQNDVN